MLTSCVPIDHMNWTDKRSFIVVQTAFRYNFQKIGNGWAYFYSCITFLWEYCVFVYTNNLFGVHSYKVNADSHCLSNVCLNTRDFNYWKVLNRGKMKGTPVFLAQTLVGYAKLKQCQINWYTPRNICIMQGQ